MAALIFSGCTRKYSAPRGSSPISTEGFKGHTTIEKKMEWLDILMFQVKKSGRETELPGILKDIAVKAETTPFASYVNFLIADMYWNKKEKELAIFYMHKIPEKHYAILYNEQEIGYIIALRSISMDNKPQLKEKKCLFLLEHYKDMVDEDTILFELIGIYKEQFEIEKAISCMEKILVLSRVNRSLDKRIDLSRFREEVHFFYSDKKWLHKDLRTLMYNIKKAIQTKNSRILKSYMTDINFEILEPQRFNRRSISLRALAIHTKWHSNIIFAADLEDFSNENEAYWKTRNWNLPNMREWFFYFKRIHYPYDETIDGAWEWKAIYFGSIH